MSTQVKRRPRRLMKSDLVKMLDGQSDRLMHLDLVGTAEAAVLLGVERARIGKWRRNGILLGGERVEFPDPIRVVTTCAVDEDTGEQDHSKLAASPVWWGDDVRALAKRIGKRKPRE